MTGKRIGIETIEGFFLDEMGAEKVFRYLERADFMLLIYIERLCENSEDGRVYLRDLAKEMDVTMSVLSKMITSMQDKGYVSWKTSETKSGTYVQLTNRAKNKIKQERDYMRELFSKIRRAIPADELETTMATVSKISEIARKSREKK
ncbi:MAG: MarR family winged helix-turn-helix transcriptional regulator [Lachnospiraceae bacterium]|nr:MarR family winged helix-turn-helix transcriptional regulator [Lachnospiraceae bacterium]